MFKGFSRQEYCSGLPFPPPGDLHNLVTKSRSAALQADSLPTEPPGKSLKYTHFCRHNISLKEYTVTEKKRYYCYNFNEWIYSSFKIMHCWFHLRKLYHYDYMKIDGLSVWNPVQLYQNMNLPYLIYDTKVWVLQFNRAM